MSSEWYSGKLGDVIELKRGYDLPQAKRNKGMVPLVSSSGVSDSHDAAMVKGPGVVTGRYGTIGQVFYVEEDFWPLNTTLYVRDFKGNHPKFVHYFLKTVDFLAFSDKAAVPGVNRNHLHEAAVFFPPVNEQKAIASFLGALDDRIALLRETNATLEAIAQALFKSWFVDFDPVRAKAEGRARQDGERSGQPRMPQASDLPRPGAEAGAEAQGQPEGAIQGSMSAAEGRMPKAAMDATTAALFPDSFEESELGLVPKGWRVGQLGNELRIAYGKNLPTTKLLDSGYPVFGGNGLIGFFSEYLYESRQVLVACRGAASGKVNQSPPKAFVTNNSLVLEETRELPFSYLKGFMSSTDLTPYVTGSAQPQVTIENLKVFKILVPSEAVVAEFEAAAGLIEDRIEQNNIQAQTLTQLRDTLLPRLISGQLRLPEAEALLEDSL